MQDIRKQIELIPSSISAFACKHHKLNEIYENRDYRSIPPVRRENGRAFAGLSRPSR